MDIRKLTDQISVSPQIKHSDLVDIAALGFKTIINNRPDREVPFQPRTRTLEKRAEQAGLDYIFLPVISGHMTQKDIDDFRAILKNIKSPVLAFCRTGTRSANLWARANVNNFTAAEITCIGAQAGYEL